MCVVYAHVYICVYVRMFMYSTACMSWYKCTCLGCATVSKHLFTYIFTINVRMYVRTYVCMYVHRHIVYVCEYTTLDHPTSRTLRASPLRFSFSYRKDLKHIFFHAMLLLRHDLSQVRWEGVT